MVPLNTLFGVILLILTSRSIEAFKTSSCDHGNVTTSQMNLQSCVESTANSGNDDYCSPLQLNSNCVTKNLKECFSEDDVKRVALERVLIVKKVTKELMLHRDVQKSQGFSISEAQIDSAYSACPQIPDKSFSENPANFISWALRAGAKTDNNCSEAAIEEVNLGLGECQKTEMENANTQIKNMKYLSRSLYSTFCSIMDETIGKCLRRSFPDCFTERERVFIRSTMKNDLGHTFMVIDGFLGSKMGRIMDCSVFSNSKRIYSTFSMVYVLIVAYSVVFFF